MTNAARKSGFLCSSLVIAALSCAVAGIFMLSTQPLQAQTPLPAPATAPASEPTVAPDTPVAIMPPGSPGLAETAPPVVTAAPASPPVPDIGTAGLRALMPDFSKGKDKTAFGKVMLEEFFLDTMTIVRMQAQKSIKANNIEQMMAGDTTNWRGTPIKMEAAKSPYNTVITIVGTALAADEVAVLWQVGWTDEGDKGSFQTLSSGPKSAVAAGQRISFTVSPRAVSVRDPKAMTPGLQLANTRNFKIEAVRVQIWSGMPETSFFSGAGTFLVYGSATGAIMIGLWWFFFRRNSYSVNDELAENAQDEDDQDESFQRRKKLAASKAAALAATGKPGELPPPEAMSPDEFTAHFMRELASNTGGAGMSTREPLEVRVQTPDGIEKTLFLANAYMTYKRNPSALNQAVGDQVRMYTAQFPNQYSGASASTSHVSSAASAPTSTAPGAISGNHSGGALDFTHDDSLDLKIVRPVTGSSIRASSVVSASSVTAPVVPASPTAPATPVSASLGVPHHQIFATIKHPAYLASVREQLLRAGASESEIGMQLVSETLNDELIVVYMIDTPEAMRALTAKDLSESALARNSLRSLALTNLGNHVKKQGMKLVDVPVEGSDAKIYGVLLDGNYEATLMLVNSIWANPKFKVKGKPVVFPLARDVLMITGSEDSAGLQGAANRCASTFAETPYAISPHGFVFDNGQWTRFI